VQSESARALTLELVERRQRLSSAISRCKFALDAGLTAGNKQHVREAKSAARLLAGDLRSHYVRLGQLHRMLGGLTSEAPRIVWEQRVARDLQAVDGLLETVDRVLAELISEVSKSSPRLYRGANFNDLPTPKPPIRS